MPPYFFGVEPASEPLYSSDFGLMRSVGIGSVRVTFDAATVRRSRHRSAWGRFDRLVAETAIARLRPVGLLFRSVSRARAKSSPTTARGRRLFARFARRAVARYGPSGSFWSRNPELPYSPIQEWEVWNEPNYDPFWPGGASPRSYGRLLRGVARAVRRVDPEARLAVGGLPVYVANPVQRYLDALYRLGMRRYFDAVAVHPYAPDAAGVQSALASVRDVMRRHGDRRKPLWVTEVGWCTAGPGFVSGTPEDQAQRLVDTFHELLRNRHSLGLDRVLWFSWRDLSLPGDSWDHHCGLFDVNGAPRPAWSAFSSITAEATRGWFQLDGTGG